MSMDNETAEKLLYLFERAICAGMVEKGHAEKEELLRNEIMKGLTNNEYKPIIGPTYYERNTSVCVNCRQVQAAHGPDGICPPAYPYKWFAPTPPPVEPTKGEQV
jgi:hypothetical protein